MVMACSSFLFAISLCVNRHENLKLEGFEFLSAFQRSGNGLPLENYAKSKPCWMSPTKLMRAAFKSVCAAMRASALWGVPESSMFT